MPNQVKRWTITSGPDTGKIVMASAAWMADNYGGETYELLERGPRPATSRTLLSGLEWVETWTAAEWRQLKRAAAGELSPTPIPDNVAQRLDQLLDAVRLTNSFDVQGDTANLFYEFLESNGFIDAQRRAELQAGITE